MIDDEADLFLAIAALCMEEPTTAARIARFKAALASALDHGDLTTEQRESITAAMEKRYRQMMADEN